MVDMENTDIGALLKLFIREGFVLDFTTPDFDVFTMNSVGESLCQKYQLPKGKSLIKFANEANDDQVLKLFSDLMSYYETSYRRFEEETHDKDFFGEEGTYKNIYISCKNILSKYSQNSQAIKVQAEQLKSSFSTDYMTNQINLMIRSLDSNPTEAIGKSKELIESCCKTILNECSIDMNKDWTFQQLVNKTFEVLHLLPKNIDRESPLGQIFRQMFGSLKGLINPIAAIRNTYGTGHGKGIHFKGLDATHAKLIVGICCTVTQFLWDTHISSRELKS